MLCDFEFMYSRPYSAKLFYDLPRDFSTSLKRRRPRANVRDEAKRAKLQASIFELTIHGSLLQGEGNMTKRV